MFNEIDIVITYVDCTDPIWQKTIEPYKSRFKVNRFRSWNNLIYLLRGISKYMSWINKVYLVVQQDSQVPSWVNRDTVNIVCHEDIIPKQYLPTFNSCVIELFLGKIKNLLDKFIYFNDDMFPINYSDESDFFFDNKPCIYVRDKYLKISGNKFRHQCYNSSVLSSELNGIKLNNKIYKFPQHICLPILKSSYDIIWEKESSKLFNSITKFRESNNFNQYLFHLYSYFSNNYINKKIDYQYVDFKKFNIINICKYIELQSNKFICINDSGVDNKFELYKTNLINSFNKILPDKCKYEL